MNTSNDLTAWIDQQLQLLKTPGTVTPDKALELAAQVTERTKSVALELEERQAFDQAATLYDYIVSAWESALAAISEERQMYYTDLVAYWKSRAEEARQRAEELAASQEAVARQQAETVPGTPGTRPATTSQVQRPVHGLDQLTDKSTFQQKGQIGQPEKEEKRWTTKKP